MRVIEHSMIFGWKPAFTLWNHLIRRLPTGHFFFTKQEKQLLFHDHNTQRKSRSTYLSLLFFHFCWPCVVPLLMLSYASCNTRGNFHSSILNWPPIDLSMKHLLQLYPLCFHFSFSKEFRVNMGLTCFIQITGTGWEMLTCPKPISLKVSKQIWKLVHSFSSMPHFASKELCY